MKRQVSIEELEAILNNPPEEAVTATILPTGVIEIAGSTDESESGQGQLAERLCTREYEPHQQRVLDEKKELGRKINQLWSFTGTPLFATLPDDERVDLLLQARFMESYHAILERRISRF